MKYTRDYVELKGRMHAGVISEHDEWLMVKALGTPIYVRKDDLSVSPCLVRDGYWESWITAWFLNNITADTRFVDIGANTGYYALLAANFGASVIAYEPNPQYVHMLRASTKIGDLGTDDFSVLPYAVSNEVGTATLTIPEGLQGSATIVDVDLSRYSPSTIQVSTVTLDLHMAELEPKPTLIKVDAEGAEEMIWDGAPDTLSFHRPVWMLEYTPGAYSKDFLSKLESYGDLAWINHSGEEEAISQNEIITYADWLMLVVRPRG